MSRTLSLATCCLILTFANSAVAQKPFKNKIAVAAKKSYEQAIAEAKKEYVAKLKIAIKDAGGAGKLEEAKQIEAEMKRIDGTDPLTAFRRRMIGTKWYTELKTRKSWFGFSKDNVGVDFKGRRFVWYVTAKNTVVWQYPGNYNLTVYLMHCDADVRTGRRHAFKKQPNTFAVKRVR